MSKITTMLRYKIAALFLMCTVFWSGCEQREEPFLYIYCNETFWNVMQEEALFFNKIYSFQVVLIPLRAEKEANTVNIGADGRTSVPWRPRGPEQQTNAPHTQINPDIESQLKTIGERSFGDMFLSDSQRHLDTLRETAVAAREYVVCYLTLTMLVPKDNPLQFRSAKDVLDSDRRLGIVNPSLDGLGETSWKMLGKIIPGGESAIPMELVRFYERQYDLLEALEQGNIDAALVWNATSQTSYLLTKYAEEYNAMYESAMRKAQRKKDKEGLRRILRTICEHIVDDNKFAEEVPLTQTPQERHVVSVRLVALGTATNFGSCERFADFMRSKQGKEILQRFGFVTE